jgi:hypothetical protein
VVEAERCTKALFVVVVMVIIMINVTCGEVHYRRFKQL